MRLLNKFGFNQSGYRQVQSNDRLAQGDSLFASYCLAYIEAKVVRVTRLTKILPFYREVSEAERLIEDGIPMPFPLNIWRAGTSRR